MEKNLRLSLYSGIGLIVISMLFLGRDQATITGQVALAIAVPAIFYSIGLLVYRYLNAPLAAPGIVATGAWLVVVEMLHLWSQRALLPEFVRPYYWLIAALLAAGIVSLTGHRVRIWLLVPLVPLTQINATWAVLGASTINIEWWSALSFLLVLAWWEYRGDEEWTAVYKASAVLLAIFLLVFSYWLPIRTERTMLTTWGAGAILVAVVGVRHSLVNMGPLALAMLTCAAAWGLPMAWWPITWLVIASATILFIERLARLDKQHSGVAIDLSVALGVLLCGAAALTAKLFPFFAIPMHPLLSISVLLGSGFLLGWMGFRGSLVVAEHIGLWLIAAGWAELYFYAFPETDAFGLWLSFLAVIALLAERLLTSARKQKRKMLHSILQTVTRWSLADLILGLTGMIIIWCAMNVTLVPPLILSLTLLIVISVWMVAGLIYRLPVLLHIALVIAPLPYALLLLLAAPPFRTLPMIGLAWQLLAIGFILLGHFVPKYRPAMLAPFFVAGYGWLLFGMTLTLADPILLLVGLALVIIVSLASGIAAVTDGHPAWSALIAWLIVPEQRPYAFKYVHNSFLFFGAWLMVVWLQLMLDHAQLATSHKGVSLVVFSCLWIMLGRLLARLPGLVGTPIYAAGWFMWLMGLLQVFFAPAEALATAVVGLLFTGDAFYRSKERYWLPVFILQVVFSVLQISLSFDLSAHNLILAVLLLTTAGAVQVEHLMKEAARLVIGTAGFLMLGVWLFTPDLIATGALMLFAGMGMAHYRRWEWWGGVVAAFLVLGFQTGLPQYPILMLFGGVAVMTGGLFMVKMQRPAGFRTFSQLFFVELDWASPLLWAGCLLMGGAVYHLDSAIPLFIAAIIAGAWTVAIRVPRFPIIGLAFFTGGLFMVMFQITSLPIEKVAPPLAMLNLALALLAVLCHGLVMLALTQPRPFNRMRWLVWWVRPAIYTGNTLAFFSFGTLSAVYLYGGNQHWIMLNLLALSLLMILLYNKTGQIRWIGAGLFMGWLAWHIFTLEAGWTGIQWQTLPVALVLLFLSRDIVRAGAVEYAGLLVLFGGHLLDFEAATRLTLLMIGVQWGFVLIYGYLSGRRLPFLAGLLAVISGGIFQLFMISPWLVPLAIGVTIVGGVLFVETQRPLVEQWFNGWQHRLGSWE